jgi:RNA polymerase sigma factor (sigma-70 family)
MTRTDEELMRDIAEGSRAALTELYRRYERPVYGFALRMVRDSQAAEEIVQDVFTRIWKAREYFNPSSASLRTWMLTIAKRIAIDYIRSRQRRGTLALDSEEKTYDVPDGAALPDEMASNADTSRQIRQALDSLPSDQRIPIERMYYEGLTQQEIAEILSVPIGTVKSRIRLGMEKLRRQLTSVEMEETL